MRLCGCVVGVVPDSVHDYDKAHVGIALLSGFGTANVDRNSAAQPVEGAVAAAAPPKEPELTPAEKRKQMQEKRREEVGGEGARGADDARRLTRHCPSVCS